MIKTLETTIILKDCIIYIFPQLEFQLVQDMLKDLKVLIS